MRRLLLALSFGLLAVLSCAQAFATPVLLISIDGLRPADVLQAQQRGLKLPNLEAFLQRGAYAHDVRGVLPTLTYPSHTTLITGVSPNLHGIGGNLTFDPINKNQQGWDWYASDIKVPTLWDAAHMAGLSTANVHWPVSVGAQVDWNLPQIWRTGTADDRKLLAALATPGLLPSLEQDLGPYADGIAEDLPGDQNRTRFAVKLLETRKPYFMTAYLTALDTAAACERPEYAGVAQDARRHRPADRRPGGRRAACASEWHRGDRLRSRLRAGTARRQSLSAVPPGWPDHAQGR